jgi:tRNA threonylcarbamoyladenosine biosynthesis protein TsaB
MSNPPHQGALLLGIDTSGAEGSLALARSHADNAVTLLSQKMLNGRSCSAELIPRLQEVFREAGIIVADLAAIIVVTGPGSFTGLRIGISAAKALAEAASLPIIAVSRLAILSGLGGNTAALLDAGRGEYYLCMPVATQQADLESLQSESSLLDVLQGQKLCICEPPLAERLSSLQPLLLPAPRAFDAISLALPRFIALDFDDVATLDANYVRRPYAHLAASPLNP